MRIFLGVTLVCLAAACQQETPPPEDEFIIQTPTGGAGVTGEVDVSRVVEHLRANDLPLERVDVYDAETDPLKRLGRPGQYVGKAIFHDGRMPLEMQTGSENVISFQSSGGIIETYPSPADVETRLRALEVARAQFPAAPPEYQYTNGVILLRLGHVLTPDQAAQYETAIQSFQP